MCQYRATKKPSTDTLIHLTNLILNKDTFSVLYEVFSLVSAVAMGCIFMGHFEYLLLHQYKQSEFEIYKTYIDDIVAATPMNYNQLLDLNIHYRTTDSHSYIDYRSDHHHSITIVSKFLRLRRLCSDDAFLAEKADEMNNYVKSINSSKLS